MPIGNDNLAFLLCAPDLTQQSLQCTLFIQVNENGAFSFDDTWKFSHPERFPGTRFHLRQHQVVSPFWSDNDIRKEGTVRYVTVESGSSGRGAEIVNEATTYVREQLNGGPDFQPTWMIVAQWDRVHPHPHGANSHQGVSEEYLNKVIIYCMVFATL